MKINDVTEATTIVEGAYEIVNELISFHGLDMIDLAYPEHDGEQDAEAVAEMMMLRMAANRLAIACNNLVGKLNDAIEDEDENKE